FAIDRYTIAASAGANGSINPLGVVNVDYGNNQQFVLTPSTGYHLDSIFVDGAFTGSSSPYTFTNVSSNHTIQVIFAINTYSITVAYVGHGVVSPSGTITAAYGSSLSLNMIPDVHYAVDSLVIDGSTFGSMTGYVFNNITSSHSVTAYFGIAGPYSMRYR